VQKQQPDTLGAFVLKISDMGLSKQLDREHHSFSSLSLSVSLAGRETAAGRLGGLDVHTDHSATAAGVAAVGTVGWQAPELIRHRYDRGTQQDTRDFSPSAQCSDPGATGGEVLDTPEQYSSSGLSEKLRDPLVAAKLHRKRTLTVDVFSLGCVFYFTITLGSHPFGQWYEREANIAAGRADLSLVRDDPLALDLIAWMLHPDPQLRPSSKGVCAHAFFWPAARRLDFLMEFSDRLEQEPADAAVVLVLEAGMHVINGGRWDAALDALLLADLSRFRKYDCASIRDLLRVIRNKRHHFYELPPELREAMGALPAEFLRYFESRFPQLLLHCATVAGSFLHTEAPFACCAGSTSPPRCRRTVSQPSRHPPTEAPAPENSSADGTLLNPTSKDVSDIAASKESAWVSARQAAAWWMSADSWVVGSSRERKKAVASHLTKATEDAKYRTRLCSQWEESGGAACAMRKKGKCVFAHGPLELRAKDSRRGKWGRPLPAGAATLAAWECSGGENVLGDARMLAQGRSAMVAGGISSADLGFTSHTYMDPSHSAHGDALLWQQHLQHQQQQQYHQFHQQYAPPQQQYQHVPAQMPMQAASAFSPRGAAAPYIQSHQPLLQPQHAHLAGTDTADQRRSSWEAAQGYPAHSFPSTNY
jgi:serine/threonine protein kinase